MLDWSTLCLWKFFQVNFSNCHDTALAPFVTMETECVLVKKLVDRKTVCEMKCEAKAY